MPVWQGSQGGLSRVAGVVQYHFVLNLTYAVQLFYDVPSVLCAVLCAILTLWCLSYPLKLLRHPLCCVQ